MKWIEVHTDRLHYGFNLDNLVRIVDFPDNTDGRGTAPFVQTFWSDEKSVKMEGPEREGFFAALVAAGIHTKMGLEAPTLERPRPHLTPAGMTTHPMIR